MALETGILVFGILLATGLNVLIAKVAAATVDTQWTGTVKLAADLIKLVAFAGLIVPKALVLLNEIVGLAFTVLRTAAAGARDVWGALTDERSSKKSKKKSEKRGRTDQGS